MRGAPAYRPLEILRHRAAPAWAFIALLLAGDAAAECVYTARVGSLHVLRHPDMTELFAVSGIATATGRNLLIDGDQCYFNRQRSFEDEIDPFPPGRVHQIDLIQRSPVADFETGRLNIDAALASGKLYIANAASDSVSIIDPLLGTSKTLSGIAEFPSAVAVTPDGSRVFVHAATAEIYVIDTEDDRVLFVFDSMRGLEGDVLATDSLLFVSGAGPGDLIAFELRGGTYVPAWEADLGFSRKFVIIGDLLYSISRSTMESVSLLEPHDTVGFRLTDDGTVNLYDAVALDGYLYVASNFGIFRYTPADGSAEIVYPFFARVVAAGPCPWDTFTFFGDADCDAALTPADVDATVAGIYDRSRRCFADCSGDGRIGAADVACAARELASATGVSRTPFPTRTPRPTRPPLPTRTPPGPRSTRTPTWTPGPCVINTDCPPEGYCKKPPGHCDDAGSCVFKMDACVPLFNFVCGCDGLTYENASCAGIHGVNVDYEGPCLE